MSKLKPEDLDKISNKLKKDVSLRDGKARGRMIVHMGTCGIASGARKISSALIDELEEREIDDVIVTISSCAGFCSREPMITVEMPDEPPVKYADLDAEKAIEILNKHVLGGAIVDEYALSVGSERIL